MATIEVILRDDEGKPISSSKSQTYQVELGRQTLHEIEGGVEVFKQQTLPDFEQALLKHAQTTFTQEKKRQR